MKIEERMSRLQLIVEAMDQVSAELAADKTPDLNCDAYQRFMNLSACLWAEARDCVGDARNMKRETIQEFLDRGGQVSRLGALPPTEREITAQENMDRPQAFYEAAVDLEDNNLHQLFIDPSVARLRKA